MTRLEHRSETGQLKRVRGNVFSYGQAIVTKYLGGYCVATIGNALRWEADSESELIQRLDQAGYGETK